jgi:transposase
VEIVRESAVTVLGWLDRYSAEGIPGLMDAPRAGRRSILTIEFRQRWLAVVRRRPRSLEREFSRWTLPRLVDFMAEDPGIRVATETIRRAVAKEEIVFSRPQPTLSSPDPEEQVKKRQWKKRVTH